MQNADKPRYSIHEVFNSPDPHVFVRHLAPRIIGEPATTLLPVTSQQTGDRGVIEIPMTSIPIDLAEFTPKEELAGNPQLRRLWSEGFLDFVPTEEAQMALKSPEARQEQDRLLFERRSKNQRRGDQSNGPNGNFRATSGVDENAAVMAEMERRAREAGVIASQSTATGQFDGSGAGVNSSVVQVMEDSNMTDAHRVAFIRNLQENGLLKEEDKKYIRSKTNQPELRKLVG